MGSFSSSFGNATSGTALSPQSEERQKQVWPYLQNALASFGTPSYGGAYGQVAGHGDFGPRELYGPATIRDLTNLGLAGYKQQLGGDLEGPDSFVARMAGAGYGTNAFRRFGMEAVERARDRDQEQRYATEFPAQLSKENAEYRLKRGLGIGGLAAGIYGNQLSSLGPLYNALYKFSEPLPFSKSQQGSVSVSGGGQTEFEKNLSNSLFGVG